MRLSRLSLAVVLALPFSARADLVLVFPIEDVRTGERLEAENLGELSEVLRSVAEADLAFETSTANFGAPCFKRTCQIDQGAKAGVALVMTAQLSKVGARCAVQTRLLDVSKKIYKHGATRLVSCDYAGFLQGLNKTVGSVGREVRRARGDYVDTPYDPEDDSLPIDEEYDDEGEEMVLGEVAEPNGLQGRKPFFRPEDGTDCLGGDRWACSRAASSASEDGRQDLVIKYGSEGCKLAEAGSCRWAIKAQNERGRKKEALDLARRGCRDLSDGASCGWGASIEHESGNLTSSMDYAQRGCSLDDADACSWAAKIEYDAGNLPAALELTRRHCSDKKHGTSCRWAASILHAQKRLEEGLEYGRIGCEALDGASCSWAARIESDRGHQALALVYARKGQTMRDPDAFGWVAKLEQELGSPERALGPAKEGCEKLKNAVSCSWAASLSFDRGERELALRYASFGAELGDPDCRSWVAKLEHERGNSKAGMIQAKKGCFENKHAPSCRWAASIGFESGNKSDALRAAVAGCDYADADSCSWAAKLEHEAGRNKKAMEHAKRGCEMENVDACGWVETIRSSR
jgi:hypothetical protein